LVLIVYISHWRGRGFVYCAHIPLLSDEYTPGLVEC
jgi:hypothetical protein